MAKNTTQIATQKFHLGREPTNSRYQTSAPATKTIILALHTKSYNTAVQKRFGGTKFGTLQIQISKQIKGWISKLAKKYYERVKQWNLSIFNAKKMYQLILTFPFNFQSFRKIPRINLSLNLYRMHFHKLNFRHHLWIEMIRSFNFCTIIQNKKIAKTKTDNTIKSF